MLSPSQPFGAHWIWDRELGYCGGGFHQSHLSPRPNPPMILSPLRNSLPLQNTSPARPPVVTTMLSSTFVTLWAEVGTGAPAQKNSLDCALMPKWEAELLIWEVLNCMGPVEQQGPSEFQRLDTNKPPLQEEASVEGVFAHSGEPYPIPVEPRHPVVSGPTEPPQQMEVTVAQKRGRTHCIFQFLFWIN